MAHIGEEDALRLVRLARRLARLFELALRGLEGPLGLLARVDVAPRADHLDRIAILVADEMLLVAHPAIGPVLAAEAILGEMLASRENRLLLRLDFGEVLRMHPAPPEIRILQVFVGMVAKHVGDAVADEGRREIAARREAVDHGRRRTEQHRQPLMCCSVRLFGLFPRGDVGPGADDLRRLALVVAQHLLPVVDPAIGAVLAPHAVFNRAAIVLEGLVDPRIDAGHVIGMHALAPEVGMIEIFARADIEQPADALAHEGRLEVAGREPAVDHRGRCIDEAGEMDVRRFLDVGDALKGPLFLLARRLVEDDLKRVGNRFGIRLARGGGKHPQNPGGGLLRVLPDARHAPNSQDSTVPFA